VISKLHRFFDDDERRRELDRLLELLDAALATSVPATYRLDGAALLKRVFGVDVLKCSRCQGQMPTLRRRPSPSSYFPGA
jgi:hypothetical protein